MTDLDDLLLALQHADGQFPSGGFAFSWGLEGLAQEGAIERRELTDFLTGQIRCRWAGFDRVVVAHAWRRAADPDALAELDRLVEAHMPVAPLRAGSRRAGQALLGVHARLKTPGVAAYDARVRAGQAPGHLPLAQGLAWRGVGMNEAITLTSSAYTFVSGLAMAALRLGLAGHLDVQRALIATRAEIGRATALPLPDPGEINAFTPLTDIAAQRHHGDGHRLFSN